MGGGGGRKWGNTEGRLGLAVFEVLCKHDEGRTRPARVCTNTTSAATLPSFWGCLFFFLIPSLSLSLSLWTGC